MDSEVVTFHRTPRLVPDSRSSVSDLGRGEAIPRDMAATLPPSNQGIENNKRTL